MSLLLEALTTRQKLRSHTRCTAINVCGSIFLCSGKLVIVFVVTLFCSPSFPSLTRSFLWRLSSRSPPSPRFTLASSQGGETRHPAARIREGHEGGVSQAQQKPETSHFVQIMMVLFNSFTNVSRSSLVEHDGGRRKRRMRVR